MIAVNTHDAKLFHRSLNTDSLWLDRPSVLPSPITSSLDTGEVLEPTDIGELVRAEYATCRQPIINQKAELMDTLDWFIERRLFPTDP